MVTTRSQSTASVSKPPTLAVSTNSTTARRHRASVIKSTAHDGKMAQKKLSIPPVPAAIPIPPDLPFTLQPVSFGLIQERIYPSLYALLVQAILWNQTRGLQARPVLFALLSLYPTPPALASAALARLTALLQPIGLHNIRAARLIAFARAWVTAPPCKKKRYRKLHYPQKGDGADVGPNEVLGEGDERVGWEVAHLPGMGAYALDSFRIFGRDRLRGSDGLVRVGEEWRRVVPQDKDLRAYLIWKWKEEGWEWNPQTGKRTTAKLDDVAL